MGLYSIMWGSAHKTITMSIYAHKPGCMSPMKTSDFLIYFYFISMTPGCVNANINNEDKVDSIDSLRVCVNTN